MEDQYKDRFMGNREGRGPRLLALVDWFEGSDMSVEEVGYWHLKKQLDRIERKVDSLMSLRPEIQTAVDEVAGMTVAVDAAVKGFQMEEGQIKALKDEIDAMQPGDALTQEDKDALAKMATDLHGTNVALQKAVPANVPEQPSEPIVNNPNPDAPQTPAA